MTNGSPGSRRDPVRFRNPRSAIRNGVMETWRLIRGTGRPAENMALDTAMAWGVGRGLAPPTLRLYRWDPPAISLGYAQRREVVLDLEACALEGLAVVRRPTGGRAVLHAGDLTYAVAVPRRGIWAKRGVAASCRRVHEAVAAGLNELGVRVQLAGPRPPLRAGGGGSGALCFAALSSHEITVQGRKLVGSAQRRFRGAILQHGSIPFTTERSRLAALVRADPWHAERVLEETMVSLGEILKGLPDPASVTAALARGFAGTFGIRLAEWPWHPAERALAARLESDILAGGGACPLLADPDTYLDTLSCVC